MFAHRPVAIVDVGSNSVRLVVFSGAGRAPSVVFNEKVSAGLGRGLRRGGALGEEAQARALDALRRFRLLTRAMGVARTGLVATAAVREASNGADFVAAVRALGFDPQILSGEEEARLAGLGVLSAIPEADGIVGDLGGGSLELVELSGGRPGRSATLPLGILRLDAVAAGGEEALAAEVGRAVAEAGFAGAAEGRPLYLVGGSWRNLARFEMAVSRHPLPVTHQHAMEPSRPRELARTLRGLTPEAVRSMVAMSAGRSESLARASQLLAALVEALAPALLISSSFGIREGLLFDDLDAETRAQDPLLVQAREAGAGLGRFEQHGALLDRWIAPVCEDGPAAARLRRAACLLADVAWAAHPDYRAERGLDLALHGNWVAIDAPGRVMLGQALYANLAGGRGFPDSAVAALCSAEDLKRATRWGLAIALGQRLSGGVAAGLERSRLERTADALRLTLRPDAADLAGRPVESRLRTLAAELGLRPELTVAER